MKNIIVNGKKLQSLTLNVYCNLTLIVLIQFLVHSMKRTTNSVEPMLDFDDQVWHMIFDNASSTKGVVSSLYYTPILVNYTILLIS